MKIITGSGGVGGYFAPLGKKMGKIDEASWHPVLLDMLA